MSPFVIPIVAMMIPMILVPTALGIKHARLLRELEHKERMKALELGRTLPQDQTWSIPAQVALWIAVGVPAGAFGCAAIGTNLAGYHEEMWIAAMSVSITSVISGTVLAARHFGAAARAEHVAGKPMMDEDAYDVVGSRG